MPMELIELSVLIACLCASIINVGLFYRAFSWIQDPENLSAFIMDAVDKLANTEEGQKTLYVIGGMVGQGVKTGFGAPKSSGKFSLNNLFGQIVAGYFGNMQQQQPDSNAPGVIVPQKRDSGVL